MPLRIPGSLPVRIGLYVGAGLIALWVGLRIMAAIPGQGLVQVYQAHHRVPVPVEVPVVKQVTRWKTQTVEVPVQVFVPTEKEAAKIEKETGFHVEPTDRTLGIFDTPRAPRGGKAWVRLDEEGVTRFSFVENKAPFLELGGPWRVGLGASYDPSDKVGKIGWEAELRKDLATIKGDWHLTAGARVSLESGETNGRVFAQIGKSF